MADLILLELAGVVAFLYSLLSLCISFAPVSEVFLVFIWTVAAAVFSALAARKFRIWELLSLLLLLPLAVYSGRIAVFFILVTAVPVYLYTKTFLLKGSHQSYAGNLKKTALIFLLAAYLRSFPWIPFNGSLSQATPFLMVYFLSSIVLIRSIRHLDSGMDMKRIKKANLRYSAMILFLSALTAFEEFRNFILTVIKSIPYLVIYPVYWLLLLVGMVFDFLSKVKGDSNSGWEPPWGNTPEFPEGAAEEAAEETFSLDFSIIQTIITILLLVLVIYIFYKILSKAGSRGYHGLEYTEEREYIREQKPKRKRPSRDRFPGSTAEQIRYYYRRFLDKLARNHVEILPGDTSLDINRKAEAVLAGGTERIRQIYIESRYGEKEADRGILTEMEKLYRELHEIYRD